MRSSFLLWLFHPLNIIKMKKYAVLKKIGNFSATVEREFDNIDDARMFKNLLVTSESGNWEYYLVEVLE